jgi:hypothetical protein
MIKTINILLLFIITLGPVLLAIAGYQVAAGVLLPSLIVVLLAININPDRFEEVAFGPLKAKLREKIHEANQLSVQLKNAIKLTLSVAVSAAMRTGRFADKDKMFHRRILESVEAIVRDTGLSESDRAEAQTEFVYFTDIDYRHAFVGSQIHSGSETGPLARAIIDTATPNKDVIASVKKLAELYEAKAPELNEWIQDYEYFVQHKSLRRPDAWFLHQDDRQDIGLIRLYGRNVGDQ